MAAWNTLDDVGRLVGTHLSALHTAALAGDWNDTIVSDAAQMTRRLADLCVGHIQVSFLDAVRRDLPRLDEIPCFDSIAHARCNIRLYTSRRFKRETKSCAACGVRLSKRVTALSDKWTSSWKREKATCEARFVFA